MVCVNETLTLPRLVLVVVNPNACSTPSGSSCQTTWPLSWGRFCRRRPHRTTISSEATPRCTSVAVTGKGKLFSARLL